MTQQVNRKKMSPNNRQKFRYPFILIVINPIKHYSESYNIYTKDIEQACVGLVLASFLREFHGKDLRGVEE